MIVRAPRYLFALLVAALLLSVIGCGGGSKVSSTPPPVNAGLFTPNYIRDLPLLLHWDHAPVRFAFQLPDNWSQIYGADQDLYVHSADEWNQAGRQALASISPPGTPADVTVTFVQQSILGGDTIGQTQYAHYPSGQMSSASIRIGVFTSHGAMSVRDVQSVIAHEMGHALGIAGHSPTPSDLMYAVHMPGVLQHATERDLNTVMSAYPSYFGRAIPFERGTAPLGKPRTDTIE